MCLNTTCCSTNYPSQYALHHPTQLAAQHNMMPIIWPETTNCQTNRPTQYAVQYTCQNTAKRTLLPNIICCAIFYPYQYAVRHAGRLAAQHNTMPIIWPDTTCRPTAQQNMLCNMLPNWTPNTACIITLNTICFPTNCPNQYVALHHATQLASQHDIPLNTTCCAIC